jgi:hypothetical protein
MDESEVERVTVFGMGGPPVLPAALDRVWPQPPGRQRQGSRRARRTARRKAERRARLR